MVPQRGPYLCTNATAACTAVAIYASRMLFTPFPYKPYTLVLTNNNALLVTNYVG